MVAWVWPDLPGFARAHEIVLFGTFDHASKTEVVGLVGGNGLQLIAQIFSKIADVGCCWAVAQIGDIAKRLQGIVVGDERGSYLGGESGASLNSFSKLVWGYLGSLASLKHQLELLNSQS